MNENKIVIQKLEKKDLPQLIELENKTFTIPWSLNSFEQELNNPVAHYKIAKINNKLIGYIGIWKILNEGHITNIAVDSEYRHQGIGSLLLNTIISFSKENDINTIFLEVRESNTPAINLYKKFNFNEIAIRKNYYQDNHENAIIMNMEITSPLSIHSNIS